MSKVVHFDRHPRRVIEKIRAIAQDLSRVDYSGNMNDLVRARNVSMSAVWACLEKGSIPEEHLHFEEKGIYAKIEYIVADTEISIDVLLYESSGEERLLVMWADQIEEE